ncbi:MAG: hypothetical protein K2Z80_21155 [Xanthobacteraceae bacterium]|nr:hypothetical protein [Xanthobacteraceae bacterium]
MADALTAAQLVLRALAQERVDCVFTETGGLIDDSTSAFGAATGVQAIVAAREAGAGFMAYRSARTTQARPGMVATARGRLRTVEKA